MPMPLQLIGAGFGRTGTMSTYTALKALGLPCYHMMEVLRNPANKRHLNFWRKVADAPDAARQDWETVFAQYTASVDNPAVCVWKELVRAYPHAKVLLTLHPKGGDAWYDSVMETIYFTENTWQFKVLHALTPFGRKFGDMSHKLVWQHLHRDTMPDRAKAVAFYNRHIEEVKAAVPEDKLLVFTVNQGWAPLCNFLGVAMPNTPFPNVNDRADFQKIKQGISRGAYVILGGLGVLAAAIVGGLAWAVG
jgi:Sulfotransferase domain